MSLPKLWISTPAYGGQVLKEFASSIINLYKMAVGGGLTIVFDTMENESLIPRGRCVAVGRFLASPMAKDFDRFMFIDADVEFSPESVIRLLLSDHDVSVACYPKKYVNFEGAKKEIEVKGDRPLEMASADLVVNVGSSSRSIVNGFVEIMDGPTGFMMIKRSVLEKMRDHYPELMCVNDHSNRDFDEFPALFDCMIDPVSRRYLSEDYAFCRRWQNMGGKIYGDTQTVLGHVGNLTFGGNLASRLKSSNKKQERIPVPTFFEPKQKGGWGFLVTTVHNQIPCRTLSIIITVAAQLKRQNVETEINFTTTDSETRRMHLTECINRYDTLIYLDYGTAFDLTPLGNIDWQSVGDVMCVPSIRPVLDWERFKATCENKDEELMQHKAIVYDTVINEKRSFLDGKLYSVKRSDGKILFVNCIGLRKRINFIQVPLKQEEWIDYFKERGVNVVAPIDINTTNTIPHKCVSGLGKSSATRVVKHDEPPSNDAATQG